MSVTKKILIGLVIVTVPLLIGLLFTYEVIDIQWISFMEIQPAYRPMTDPQQLPPNAVPVQGVAFLPNVGSPQNPVKADQNSVARGQYLYGINCAICHGPQGKGDGPVAEKLVRKPANLTSPNVTRLDDGTIFLVITNGVPGTMPPLRENLAVGDRWDLVNYVRTLK
jgi:mono/diheme cytochrome c family protein